MSNSLTKEDIVKLLPHREPMLLIDELNNIKKLHSATAIVNVKKNSFSILSGPVFLKNGFNIIEYLSKI